MASSNRILHIVHGGVENGDKAWLARAAKRPKTGGRWVVPKSVTIGDEVVIYVTGHGLYATARISTAPVPREDWPNRYGAKINSVQIINRPISLGVLQQAIPELAWTRYPRSITTPTSSIAARLQALIRSRRKYGGTELDQKIFSAASLEELRRLALQKASSSPSSTVRQVVRRTRQRVVKLYALKRADGKCEFCRADAPFRNEIGNPYLECHHITELANEGADHPHHVIAICPNCHRRAHHAVDRAKVRTRMKRRVAFIERRTGR
jgi:hypothetical protein